MKNKIISPFLGLTFSLLAITSCNNSNKETVAENTTISLADTTSAKPISIEAEKITLRLNPEMGKQVRVKVEMSNTISDGKNKAEGNNSMIFTKKFVSKIGDSLFVAEYIVEEISMKNRTPNPQAPGSTVEMAYSSKDTAQSKDPRFVSYNAVIGQKVMVTFNKLGEITMVDSLDGVIANVEKAIGKKLSEEEAKFAKSKMANELLRLNFQQEQQSYQDKPLDNSRSWFISNEGAIAGFFPSADTIRTTVQSISEIKNRKVAQISNIYSSQPTLRVRQDPKSPQKAELKDYKFTSNGKTIVDYERGTTLARMNSISMDIDVEYTNAKNEKKSQHQTSTSKLEVTILK